ncbi:universal stress protein [Mycobacterium scrofulaceum]|uniref:UspA domain-containing protein n=1 Tax=Mycobacterium scrofulaceum TaxID=1783 RepID=A0A1A2VM09_MYCSC|nr:universal stress protein [Mycobacterium scrofulaceum]OBI01686.1 hypothetical protein A5679_18625 [Mycobacterium scrofulaceum]
MWRPPRNAVLVGVDGSAAALGAVRWAALTAALRRVPLAVVHVVDDPVPGWLDAGAAIGHRQRHRAREVVASALRVAEESIGEHGPLRVDGEVVHSTAVATLVTLSKEVAMVVVGYHGHGGVLVRSFLGSVSSGLVYNAHCPVAVIREAPLSNAARAPILVGIDGSSASEAATAIAFDEASRRGVGLIAFHAWADPRVFNSNNKFQDSKWDARLSEEEEALAERLAGWRERYPNVAIRRRIEIGDPAHWLIEVSELAQLIVVGSHGRGGVAGKLLGSVGSAVVNRAKVPVIVVR